MDLLVSLHFWEGGALAQDSDQINGLISQEKVYLLMNKLGAFKFKNLTNCEGYIDPRLQILPWIKYRLTFLTPKLLENLASQNQEL